VRISERREVFHERTLAHRDENEPHPSLDRQVVTRERFSRGSTQKLLWIPGKNMRETDSRSITPQPTQISKQEDFRIFLTAYNTLNAPGRRAQAVMQE
jgi:hypothetical protein